MRVVPRVRGTPLSAVPRTHGPWRQRARAVWRREDAGLLPRPSDVYDRSGRRGAAHVLLASARHQAQPGGARGAGGPHGGCILTRRHASSAIATVTNRARTIPSAPSVFSYHSVARCASPALPPAPSAIAGMPRAIGTSAQVGRGAGGAARLGKSASSAVARPTAFAGLATLNAAHEWPPGPRNVSR